MLQRPFGVVGQNLEIQKTTDSARFWSSLVLTTTYPFLLIFSALFNFTGVLLCDNICRQPPGRISWASPHCTWQWGQGSLKSSGAKTSFGSMTGLSSLSDQLVLWLFNNQPHTGSDCYAYTILHWCTEGLYVLMLILILILDTTGYHWISTSEHVLVMLPWTGEAVGGIQGRFTATNCAGAKYAKWGWTRWRSSPQPMARRHWRDELLKNSSHSNLKPSEGVGKKCRWEDGSEWYWFNVFGTFSGQLLPRAWKHLAWQRAQTSMESWEIPLDW